MHLAILKVLEFNAFFFSIFQLYELSEEPKRREFLDDLFSFMQKRGKTQFPVIFRLPGHMVFTHLSGNLYS